MCLPDNEGSANR
jgi:hypothetical protein